MKYIFPLLLAVFFSFGVQAEALQDIKNFKTRAKYAIAIEAETGTILYVKKADVKMPTSSMSKVMTMYLVFEALEKGAIKIDQKIRVSKKAWKIEGSRMFLKHAQRVKVEDLIRGVIVQSGNDAAIVLAEAVAGSEASFAALMNKKAKDLGMFNTHFVNASGLPHKNHYSTARDLAALTLALIRDYPQHYYYYSEKSFTFNKIKQGNRNPLLYRNIGVDGVKTGHTNKAGYGLISSAVRDGRRIVTVMNGLKTRKQRGDETEKLLDMVYRGYDTYTLVKKGQIQGPVNVWLGAKKTVPVMAAHDVRMTLARHIRDRVKIEKYVAKEIEAPIRKGQVMGKIIISGQRIPRIEVKLIASEAVAKDGFVGAAWAKLKRLLGRK